MNSQSTLGLKYNTYDTYRDSGVSNLGQTPLHWKVMQLKRTINGCVNGIWGAEPKTNSEDTIVLRVADFDRPKLSLKDDGFTYRNISDGEKLSRKLKSGDLLLEKSGGGERTLVGQVVLFDKAFEAVTSNFVAKMTPISGFNSGFLNYVFSRFYNENINYCSIKQNTGIQNLDSAAYLAEKFAFPLEKEQEKIANFLDHETAKIDTLIDKQQQLIKLLKEKRQAVISHAVTKGLNSDAPMRESGVEWLGEVPENWNIWKFGHFAPIITCGIASTPTYVEEEEGMPFLSAQNIQNNKLSLHKYNYISNELHNQLTQYRKPERGDVLLTRVGAGIGAACVIDIDMEFSIYVSLTHIRIKPELACNKFIVYFFASDYCQYLNHQGTVTGGGVGNLNVQNVIKYSVALPSIEEQKKIVCYLDSISGKYNELIVTSLRAIELARERRTALISAAVTGKIDVRNWTAPVSSNNNKEVA